MDLPVPSSFFLSPSTFARHVLTKASRYIESPSDVVGQYREAHLTLRLPQAFEEVSLVEHSPHRPEGMLGGLPSPLGSPARPSPF